MSVPRQHSPSEQVPHDGEQILRPSGMKQSDWDCCRLISLIACFTFELSSSGGAVGSSLAKTDCGSENDVSKADKASRVPMASRAKTAARKRKKRLKNEY
jgi:hypothetical protein